MTEIDSFEQVISRFISSMYALRVFSQEIGELAKQHDQKAIKQFAQRFLVVLGMRPEDKDKIDLDSELIEKEKEILEDKKAAAEKVNKDFSEILDEVTKEPEKAFAFVN